MDLKGYYKKLREAEAAIPSEHVVVVSLATSEGGKAGLRTETTRSIAAKLIAEGRARLADDAETAAFRDQLRDAFQKHEEQEAARRMQVVVMPAKSRPSKPRKEA